MLDPLAVNRYRPTPLVRWPSKSAQTVSEDARYWQGVQFPVSVQESGPVKCLDISPKAPHYIAVTGSARVQVYNPESNSVYKTFSKFKEGAFGAKFRSDGQLMAAGTEDGPVKMFDLATKTLLRSFKGHEQCVQRVDFTSDLKTVASFSDDQTVRLWDIATEAQVARFEGHKVVKGDLMRKTSLVHLNEKRITAYGGISRGSNLINEEMIHCLSGLVAPYRGNPINEERGGQRGIQGLAKPQSTLGSLWDLRNLSKLVRNLSSLTIDETWFRNRRYSLPGGARSRISIRSSVSEDR
eukprot:maker-scaffold115_size343722-snap-gene-2.22 protein:Tk09714 transcript:maker-scaffold115_size343722-snap-gene-2.22-mRNA-1 annotation:"u3 small nucleolar rna-associated protein 15 homolog"